MGMISDFFPNYFKICEVSYSINGQIYVTVSEIC